MEKLKVGIIGFGRMGQKYAKVMMNSQEWEIVYICDISQGQREMAHEQYPTAKIVDNEDVIFNDPEVQVVGLFTLADARLGQFRKAKETHKHVIAEKPVAESIETEWKIVDLLSDSDILATVNLYLRNAWYHHLMKSYIDEGELGELAIVRVCHMTPGLMPTEGHEHEGPAFHDCGMHYVDIARWYAGTEFKTWHAQGVRMWNYKDPWWVQCHGTFENGIVFDVTQGFVYGQLSKNQTHNSYVDLIGTKGIVRMTHDFKTAVVDLRGVTKTIRSEHDFGGKNIETLCRMFAKSVHEGKLVPTLPKIVDSVIASDYAWRFYNDSLAHDLPAIGNEETMHKILYRRAHMENGYGLIKKAHK